MRKIFFFAGVICWIAAAGLSAQQLPAYVPRAVAVAQDAGYVKDGSVTIVGYNDMAGIFANLNAIFVRTHPEFHFNMQLKGTAAAPAALAFGVSVFAPMGAEFSTFERRSFKSVTGAEPLCFRVAHCTLDPAAKSAPIGIYVNAANPIERLTTQQVAQIFTTGQPEGDITVWGQLGARGEWAPRPIRPSGIAEEAAGGLASFLLEKMGGRPFAPGFDSFPQSTEVVRRVDDDRCAIGFASANIADSRVKLLAISEDNSRYYRPIAQDIVAGAYPYDRFLLIYVRRASGGSFDPVAKEYLRLIYSREGQEAIAEASPRYFPLNPREAAAELTKLNTNAQANTPASNVAVPQAGDGSIFVMGATGMQPLLERLNQIFVRTHQNVRFTMRFLETGAGLDGLTAGVVAIAVTDREARPLELRPFRQLYGHEPLDVRIGRVGYAGAGRVNPPGIYVNAANPLSGLSMEVVSRIFVSGDGSGDVTHWNQLGLSGMWAERIVHVYGLRDDGGFASAMRHQHLNGFPFTRRYEALPACTEIVRAVAEDRYGIALLDRIDSKKLPPGVKMLPLATGKTAAYSAASYEDVLDGKYPLSPYLHVYANNPLDPLVEDYVRLALSKEGQAILAEENHGEGGIVPLSQGEVRRELSKLQ